MMISGSSTRGCIAVVTLVKDQVQKF